MFGKIQDELNEFKNLLGSMVRRQGEIQETLSKITSAVIRNQKQLKTITTHVSFLKGVCESTQNSVEEKHKNVLEVEKKFAACARAFHMIKKVLEAVIENQEDITGLTTLNDWDGIDLPYHVGN